MVTGELPFKGAIRAPFLKQRSEAVAKLPALDIVENRIAKTGTDNAHVSYRVVYRNDADNAMPMADCDGQSTYEKSPAILAQLVEQRFCKRQISL
ncbi:MAG: hypothetical protein WCT04_15535 [Planctomycetota bacterium]